MQHHKILTSTVLFMTVLKQTTERPENSSLLECDAVTLCE